MTDRPPFLHRRHDDWAHNDGGANAKHTKRGPKQPTAKAGTGDDDSDALIDASSDKRPVRFAGYRDHVFRQISRLGLCRRGAPTLYTLTNAVVDAKYHLDARKERPLMYDRYAQLLNAIEVDALRDLGHVRSFFAFSSILHTRSLHT